MIFLLVLTLTNSFINNIYYDKFKVPFVGSQSIKAEIQTENSALISLQGIINEIGTVEYNQNTENNEFTKNYIRNINFFQKIESLKHFENKNDITKLNLDEKLNKIVKKYNIEFSAPNYDEENDIISFTINVKKVFYKRIIKMKRIV